MCIFKDHEEEEVIVIVIVIVIIIIMQCQLEKPIWTCLFKDAEVDNTIVIFDTYSKMVQRGRKKSTTFNILSFVRAIEKKIHLCSHLSLPSGVKRLQVMNFLSDRRSR